VLAANWATPPRWDANSGGPSSRTRTERIVASVLGSGDGPIRCPRHLTLALDFGAKDPVTTMTQILKSAGFRHAESLRVRFGAGLSPMVAFVNPRLTPLPVVGTDPLDVLRQAFLLGLCTAVQFDPQRPVLWTQASLTRRVDLFETTEFYA
jgi:hypothetical protein